MKVRVYLYVSDGQDGSVSVYVKKSMEEAEAAVEEQFEKCGGAFCDGGATYVDIKINPDGTYEVI